jgi:peptide/nickel transport system substrate-binding protein
MFGGNTMAAKILTMLLGLTLVLAVACGSAPAAPESTTAPATEPTAAPVESPTAQPTPIPEMAAPPADVEVNPGKVTWMTGDFGSERFDAAFGGFGKQYAQLIHGYLIGSDVAEERRVLAPGIATDWSLSGDGLTWTLTVRNGAKFHDGTDVTAEDVLWTLQHIMGPQAGDYVSGGNAISISKLMDRIEQTAPDQVSVTTKSPFVTFSLTISEAGGFAGAVLPKRATLHDVEEELAYDRNPIGAGIMRLVNHVPASLMSFERFDDYYHQPKNGFATDKRVKFTTFDLWLAPEEATRAAALRAGEADIAPITLATKQQVEAGGGRVVFGQEGAIFFIQQLGCFKPQFPCSDKRVRQALQYAIDKELMRDELYGGPEVMQVKGWTHVTPSTLGYSPDLDPYPFDPDKARQLLADAGYPGGKGFAKLIVNTHVSAAMPLLPESAQLVADMWRRELGLDVEVKIGDKTALKEAAQLTEDLQGQIYWRDDDTLYDASEDLRVGKYWGGDRGPDQAHDDPELIALAAKTDAVLDPVQREKALNVAYQRFHEEAHWIGLGYANIPWGVGPRIQTWQPYPLAQYPTALHTITLK